MLDTNRRVMNRQAVCASVVFRRLTEISEYERPAGRPVGRRHAFERLISHTVTHSLHTVYFERPFHA